MAVWDGEQPPLDVDAVQRHLAACEECRAALASDEALDRVLAGFGRAVQRPDPTWPVVAQALAPSPEPRRAGARDACVLAGGAVAAVVLQVLVLGPCVGLGWAVRPLPLLAAVALFLALRVNPLRLEVALDPHDGTP
jgi:predicted anti-sigma-YlaC factor YlaD